MMYLGVLLALLVGVTLGLLGGGGSILTLPILLYVFHLPAPTAIATSLLVVGTTSAVSLVPHGRAGRVAWRTGGLFGLASMGGAFVGGRVSSHLPSALLLVAFGAMMAFTARAMLRGRRAPSGGAGEATLARVVLQGVGVGLVTGLLGAGGGFLVVPALVLLGGLSMPRAVATSLFVIAMNSAAALVGHLGHAQIPWAIAAPVTLAAALGSVVGYGLSARLSAEVLRRGFAALVAVMAVFVLGQELPRLAGHPLALGQHWPGLAAAMLGALGFVLSRPRVEAATQGAGLHVPSASPR